MVRLTRRGRLVVFGLAFVSGTLVIALAAPTIGSAEPSGPPPVVVVQPGDTLWSVVERHVPSRDPIGTIEEIRRLNGLPDYTVHAGQQLTLPRRR
jgi:LysM repeat protein